MHGMVATATIDPATDTGIFLACPARCLHLQFRPGNVVDENFRVGHRPPHPVRVRR